MAKGRPDMQSNDDEMYSQSWKLFFITAVFSRGAQWTLLSTLTPAYIYQCW